MTNTTCPNCGTPHLDDELFCEVCGLDFATGRLPEVAPAASAQEQEAEETASEAGGPPWTVLVEVDRAWFDHNEAESGAVVSFPDGAAPRRMELSGDVVSIGRRDDKRGWYPTIDLGVPVLDPSTSRHHAELRRTDDGWALVDLDSTNGTHLDGDRLAAGEPVDVVDGMVVHLGAFTRLTFEAPDGASGGGAAT